MAPTAILDKLERARNRREAKAVLEANAGLPGLSRAYFDRVAQLLHSNPSGSRRLASWWNLVLRFGDEASSAYRAKGVFERLEGKWLQSARSFRQAARSATGVERSALQTGAVDSLGRAGMPNRALRLGSHLARTLEDLGERALAGRVMLNVANALVWSDRYEASKRWYERAIEGLSGSPYELETAASVLGLATSELYSGDLRRCRELSLEAIRRFRAIGADFDADVAELNLSAADVIEGRAEQALQRLLRLRDRLAESPVEAARVEEFLGDAYFRLNMWSEALDAYRAALRRGRLAGTPMNRANCFYGIGLCLERLGSHRRASSFLKKAASVYGTVGNAVWEQAAWVAISSVARTLGKGKDASEIASRAVSVLGAKGARYHLCAALLELAAAKVGLGQSPRSELDRALRICRRYGYASLEWRVNYYRALAATEGRRLSEFRKMARAIEAARLSTTSIASRPYALRDKETALSDYLDELLRVPTPRRIAEALEVIQRSRSAALIDEILSARAASLPKDVLTSLESLRASLAGTFAEDAPGTTRRSTHANVASRLQREWVETVFRSLPLLRPSRQTRSSDCTVIAETSTGYYAIRESRVRNIAITARELAESLRWLRFELLGPAVDRTCRTSDPTRRLTELAERWLGDSCCEAEEPLTAISPDGLAWHIPWPTLLALRGSRSEPVLLTSPAFHPDAVLDKLPENPRAVIWVGRHATLPGVARELNAFLEAFPKAHVCESRSQALESLSSEGWDLLHVAGHATASYENPMFSAVHFDDGPVLAAEIARSPLRVGLVVLSACDTGSLSLINKAEPEGLTRAFLACSAKAVVASTWLLDDQAAEMTMRQFLSALRAGNRIVDALRTSRQNCRRIFEHPYFWGSWVLFGGYKS